PEAESAVLLERAHADHHFAFVVEVRHRPLDRLLEVRAALVEQPPEVLQDRLRERPRVLDVRVDPWILLAHHDLLSWASTPATWGARTARCAPRVTSANRRWWIVSARSVRGGSKGVARGWSRRRWASGRGRSEPTGSSRSPAAAPPAVASQNPVAGSSG